MTAIKYSFNMPYEAIDAGTKSVGTRSTKLREDIHKLCVSILVRWNDTGDAATAAAKATALLSAVDKYKAQAIVNWFSVYAGFSYDAEEKAFGYTATTIEMSVVKGQIFFNGDDKPVEPYWKVTPPKDAKPFDLPGKLQNLLAQAQKHRDKGLKDGDDIPPDLMRKLQLVMSGADVVQPEPAH